MTVVENGGAPIPRDVVDLDALPGRPCPVAASLALVGEKWSLLALREVFYGNHRFNDIARATGAPRDRLAARLRALVDAGVLERRAYSETPARYGYHLTPAGAALSPVLRALVTWGNTWALDQPRVQLRHRDHALDAVEVCRTCGDEVDRRELSLQTLAPNWDAHGPVE
jgi:DNA-binding HxlR family transcriptional regulator